MPAAAAIPSSVGRGALVKKVVSQEKKLKKAAEDAKSITENVTMIAIAGGAALGSGVLYAKFPEAAKIPGTDIDTDLAAGAGLVLFGALSRGKMSGGTMMLGLGLLLPWMRDKGTEIGG